MPQADSPMLRGYIFLPYIYEKSVGVCTCYSSHTLRLWIAYYRLNE